MPLFQQRGPVSAKYQSLVLQELQSDADYAEVYTRSKWRQSRWAPSRIQQVSAPQNASVCTLVRAMLWTCSSVCIS